MNFIKELILIMSFINTNLMSILKKLLHEILVICLPLVD